MRCGRICSRGAIRVAEALHLASSAEEGGNPSGYAAKRQRIRALRALRHQVTVQNPYIRQIPVSLGEIEAVADHEAVRDLEADVADGHVDLAARRLRQEGA